MSHPLDELVRAQKSGEGGGIASICSAHPWVLKAVMGDTNPVLVESTCNQVNQFGGYTGMTPANFASFVYQIAVQNNIPKEQILLGGDHLGPFPWQEEPAESAMAKAAEMVCLYLRAGFTKIHLDASMRLGDDPSGNLDPEVSACRTAELAAVAEKSIPEPAALPSYVIGTEVPIPGGAQEHEDRVHVTAVEDVIRTVELMQAEFNRKGLESAWERVIAMVVQPGVEFGDNFVLDYDPGAAHHLAKFSESLSFVYEAHSTDYQKRQSLMNLVRDHFAILKVGPALTFAYREAVFALEMIEKELVATGERSNLAEVLEQVMLNHPVHWQKHYLGSPAEKALARKYSLSDRIRYYWHEPPVQAATEKLQANLKGITIPMSLLSQFAPLAFCRVREGEMRSSPNSVIKASIQAVWNDYRAACKPG